MPEQGDGRRKEECLADFSAKGRPLSTHVETFCHPGADGEGAGRNGCLLYSGHNHWSVLEKVVTLKVFRSSTSCIDRQSS